MASSSGGGTGTRSDGGISKTLQIIVAIIAIIGFVFGVTNWGQIQQGMWKQRIIGTWQDTTGAAFVFDSDGNMIVGGNLPATGTYRFTDESHLSIQLSGLFAIAGSQVYEVRFSGDTMTWTDVGQGNAVTFQRMR